MLETACFYLYMLAAMTYIFFRQLQSAGESAEGVSDRLKVLTDFIDYSKQNLTWFSLNYVLCTMPLICILLESATKHKTLHTQSYLPIMYVLWAMHAANFFIHSLVYGHPD